MKRIISTILTISMLFTMIPAFASDIETSDVNSNLQLFSIENGEVVYASSAEKINVIKADFSSLEVGTYTETKTGTNGKVNIKQGSGGTFTVNADGSVTLKQAAGGNENATFVFDYTPKTGMVVSSYKVKFDVLSTSWTRFEYQSSFSSLYVSGGKFGLNNTYKVGTDTMGKTVSVTDTISAGKWYTVTYIIDTDAKTYKLDIVDEDGNSVIVTTEEEWSFRPTSGGAVTGSVGSLGINTAQGGQSEISVKDVYAYQVASVCGFDVIGPETVVVGSNDFRMEYNNTTSEETEFEALLVGYDADGVVVGTDIETGNIEIGSGVIDFKFDAVAADSYKVFVNEPNGASLTLKAGGVSTKAPENFVDVSCTSEGDIAVNIEKDTAYNIATVVVYDEEENIVGYAQQKNTGAPILIPVSSYNEEYAIEVMLNDAAHNVVTETESIIAWNPEIAADFNSGDVEAAFEAHMDAIKLAYDGDFSALYEENEANVEYINNYIALRDDYQSVYDIVDAIYAAEGFIAIVSAEDEATFAVAFEDNAESFGIAIDSVYEDNRDVIIAKLFAAKDDYIIPEELVEVYDDIYVACEFNSAPAILYGKLFAKYASKLGITVGKEYYEAEATYNEAVLARKVADFDGAFGSSADVAKAFRNAAYDIEGKPAVTYATVGASPLTKPVRTVDFEANSSEWAVTSNIDTAKGSAEVVNVNGNNMFKITQYAGNEDIVTFAVNGLYSSDKYDTLNIKERVMFEKLDTGYTFFRMRAAYIYLENNKWGINYGGGKMDTSGTIEEATANVWYNLNVDFDFLSKKFDLVITKDDGTVVFEDYDCDFRGNDTASLVIVTPHKDGKDANGNDRTTVEDTVIYVDDVVITAPCEPAVYYTAKSADKFNVGVNGVAVELENLTGADRNINVYIPVYANGKLYTFANETVYVEDGEKTDVIVSYELEEELFGETPAEIKYEIVVADGFDGVNHSVTSATTEGVLSVDATADFEKDIINVTTDSTFDNGTIIVLAPGATLANAIPSDILYYATGKTANVKVADGIKGDLKVYAVAQDAEGKVTVANDTVYYPGNGVAKNLVSDFSEVTNETVASVVTGYMDIINAVEPGMATFYNENSADVDAALVANKPYATTEEVINTIKSVKALKALKVAASEAEFEAAFNEFATMFDVKFDDIYTSNKAVFIATMYSEKENFNTYEDIMDAYISVYMVFDINTATEDIISGKLVKYADKLGITLDDVYKSKQAYIDRLVLADAPFADKAEIVSSYNNAYTKAEALEGDFVNTVVSKSPINLAGDEFTFDNEPITSGTKTYESQDGSFSIASTNVGGEYFIEQDGDNRYVRLTAPANTKRALELRIPAAYFGDKVEISTSFKANKLSNWILFYIGSNASCLNVQGGKFLENWGKEKAPSLNSKSISAGVWYKVTWLFDVNAKKYDLYIVNRDNPSDVIVNVKGVDCRNSNTSAADVSSITFTTSSENSSESDVVFDNITRRTVPESGLHYTAEAISTLLPGKNTVKFSFVNADNFNRDVNVYVPVYVDGKLATVNKIYSKSIEAGFNGKDSAEIDVPAELFNQGKVSYKVFVTEALDKVNYATLSNAVLPRTTTVAEPVADYTARTIKVSGTTTYDNMAILVTAPTANSSAYDIADANNNADVIAYYNTADLKEISFVDDVATDERVATSNFVADIKIADKFINGDYYVYFISQNNAGEVKVIRKSVYYAGSDKLDDMLADFNAVTDVNAETTINTYMDVLLGVASDMDAFYAANKAIVNEAIVAGKPYANVGAVNNTIFAIYAADKLKNAADVDTFKSTLEYYSNVFAIDVTSAEYLAGAAEINNRLFNDRANITKLNLGNKYANALMLSEFNNAERDEVSAVIAKYASTLGVDVNSYDYVTYIEGISKAVAADGIVFNSVADITSAINDGIAYGKANGTGNAPVPSAPAGGGGGGGGGGGAPAPTEKVYFDEPYVEAEKTVEGNAANQAAFTDLDTVSWAKEAITELKKLGVINGVSTTEFAPNREVTREEFAKMIVNAFSITGEGKTFADVPATAWYAPYVTALASSGIVNGVTETKFGVGSKITRQDAAVILDRVALKSIPSEYEYDYSALNMFTDYIADYAVDSIYRLFQNGVINGTSATTFSATATLTRAQAAKMIYSLMQLK